MNKNIILNLSKINETILEEKLDIAVISFGGCSSNTLCDILEKNGYKVRSKIYDKILCHCPSPIKLNIPIIYVYRDPREALLSMKRRGKGYWDVNQRKLSNSTNINYSDGNLLRLMIQQFNKWTKFKDNRMIILKYEELFNESISDKLKLFLDNDKLTNFPITYKKPHINSSVVDTIDNGFKNLFEKYKKEINYINNFLFRKIKHL
jgi:hypothetical protein